jgi:hypothetical protein
MTEALPENDAFLQNLVRRSPLLADESLRHHWERLIPHLSVPERYSLAAILLEVEQSL